MKKIVVLLAGAMFINASVQAQEQETVTINVSNQTEMAKQPVVVVESTPLAVSRADEIRKQRERAEVETEQKIVEKLEMSRIADEKRRQEALLGSISGTAAPEKAEQKAAEVSAAPAAAPVAQQPQVIIVQQPAVQPQPAIEVQKSPTMEDVRSAVREELTASQQKVDGENLVKLHAVKEIRENRKQTDYASGTLGMVNYDSFDIETVGAIGVAYGRVFDNRWAVEINGNFSNSYVEENNFLYRDMQQWSVGLGTRYYFMIERIRPSLGFAVSYVNRDYSDLNDIYYQWVGTSMSSWAIDYGFTAAIEFAVTKEFLFGMEYRYMNNMTYQYREDYLNIPQFQNNYSGFTPIEERNYDFWGFSVKYVF